MLWWALLRERVACGLRCRGYDDSPHHEGIESLPDPLLCIPVSISDGLDYSLATCAGMLCDVAQDDSVEIGHAASVPTVTVIANCESRLRFNRG